MRVLFVAAEMAPLAKVGGVGDVAAALPRALRRLGLDVRVALPYYKSVRDQEIDAVPLSLQEEDGRGVRECIVRDLPVYLVEHPAFDRDQVYGYDDDTARFLAFADTLLASAGKLGWQPDAIHLNDWHTGFLATRLMALPAHPWFPARRVFTIHNLGYTGAFDKEFVRAHALPDAAFAADGTLPPGLLRSALAQGIVHSHVVTTVSPTYAREIRTPAYGGALTPLLDRLDGRLVGVLNGIDIEEFDPARDPHLVSPFDADHLEPRAENKRALQERLALPVDDAVPLIGMVTRLFEQKGPEIAADALADVAREWPFQFVLLGTGDKKYEDRFAALAARYPQRFAVRLAFDVALGQLIYAGCDLFLMPSRYEPCGLGQMIAMRYGAVPVVRRTGGLADTVTQLDAQHSTGTGFLFDEPAPDAAAQAIRQALAAYQDRTAWRALQKRAMAQDLSWDRAGRRYAELYAARSGNK